MNNGSTSITYERAKQDAQTIEECRKTMQNIFDDVNRTMLQATNENDAQGKVADTLKTQFQSLHGTFQSYTSKIEQLHNLLLENIAATEATEQKQAAEASNLAGN